MNMPQSKKRGFQESLQGGDQLEIQRKKMQMNSNSTVLGGSFGEDDDSEDDADASESLLLQHHGILTGHNNNGLYSNQLLQNQYDHQQRPHIMQLNQTHQYHNQHQMQQQLDLRNVSSQQQLKNQQILIQTMTKPTRKSRRKPAHEIEGRARWTPDQDARLLAGYTLHGNSWKDVAAYVGADKNSSQCHKRYTWYVNPALANRNKDPWTDNEVAILRTLVERNNVKQTGAGEYKESINWTLISRELNRDYYDCKNKYKLVMAAGMKKGPFTQEEDALIADRVKAWGSRGNGLWVSLEKELNRRSDSIKSRAIKNKLIHPNK